ncbi:MAG: endonuclease/exonuclease/phosphatase family protein [Saprospiraceae bacterium]|nr:endonuclease/exonuclease/phosphatase family protein [Saprospiraceae bacterium]
MGSLFGHLLKIASASVVVLTLLAYVCPYVNPVRFSWLAFFGTAFPWILLANILLLIIWALRVNRFAFYHLGMIALGWQHVTGFIGFDTSKATVPENAITVATHNLGGLWRGQKKLTDALREKTASDYARFLQENGFPDLLCTQETSGKFYRLLAEKMGYPHTFNLKKGTVILSRFPMEGGGEIPFGKTANSSLWVDIRMNKQVVRIYNVHLQSNRVTNATEKVIGEAELDEGETWHDIGNVLNKVGDATQIRAEQAQLLCDHIAACPHPVIICGDFNDTPNSYVYDLIARGLTDTFREKGWGFGTTFGGALPLLRIDYILTEPSFRTYACRTVRGPFSDHYPVFVSLGIR